MAAGYGDLASRLISHISIAAGHGLVKYRPV